MKLKVPVRRKVSTKPTALKWHHPHPVDMKGGVKRVCEDEADSAMPGSHLQSPKRVKSDWEGPPNEETWKHDEQAKNAKRSSW